MKIQPQGQTAPAQTGASSSGSRYLAQERLYPESVLINHAFVQRFKAARAEASDGATPDVPGEGEVVVVHPSAICAAMYPAPRVVFGGLSLPTRIVELDIQWFQPIKTGKQFQGRMVIEDISSYDESGGSPVVVRARTEYGTGASAPVAIARVTTMSFIDASGLSNVRGERDTGFDRDESRSGSRTGEVSAADTSRLQAQDILFRRTRGPLQLDHLERWEEFIGELNVPREAVELGEDERISSSLALAFSRGEGLARPGNQLARQTYENGALRFVRIEFMLTDWLDGKGSLDRLRVLIQAPNLVGDVANYTFKATEVTRRKGDLHLSVSIRSVNQLGFVTTTAHAELRLPASLRDAAPTLALSKERAERTSATIRGGAQEDPLKGFLDWAKHSPESTALVWREGRISYGQLLASAREAAERLRSCAVAEEDVVGICLTRGAALITHIHAVLLAGAAYLVLDPDYPIDRLTEMARQCSIVLCEAATLEKSRRMHDVCVILDAGPIKTIWPPTAPEGETPLGSSLAYVMFTSGTTQKPRAAEITRGAMSLMVEDLSGLGYRCSDVCLHTASFSFSASVRQLFVPLSVGATVVLCSAEEARDPKRLLRLMQKHDVTLWDTTPSGQTLMLAYLDGTSQEDVPALALRTILLTGEPLPWLTVHRMRLRFPRATYVNLYSQTETTGTVCAYSIPSDGPLQIGIVPAGFPLASCEVTVLNPSTRRPVLDQQPGELYVSSPRLARGYRGDFQETAAHFIEDLHGCAGRWYKTGDEGYRDADGCLVVTGRGDSVVNVRGVRVSTAEVQSSIAEHPAVHEVLVLASSEESGTQSLTAFLSLTDGGITLPIQLRTEIYSSLPVHMQPRRVVVVPSLPRLLNMKVNIQLLRELSQSAPSIEVQEHGSNLEEGVTELERQLLALIREESGTTILVEEPIAHSGMDSLSAVRLAAAIELKLNRRLTLTSISEASTVRQLAGVLREDNYEGAVIVPLSGSDIMDESPLFYLPGLNGHPYDFLGVAARMKSGRRVCGLQYPREPMATFEELAAYFKQQLLRVQPEGQYLIAGHSLGGRIAFEIARQLHGDGSRTAIPIFVDASAPVLGLRPRVSRLMRRGLHYVLVMSSAARQRTIVDLFRKRLWIARGHPVRSRYLASPSHLRLISSLRADKLYRPGPFPGRAILLRAESVPRTAKGLLSKGPSLGWQRLILGGLQIVPIIGNHNTCITDEAPSRMLAHCLDEVLATLVPSERTEE